MSDKIATRRARKALDAGDIEKAAEILNAAIADKRARAAAVGRYIQALSAHSDSGSPRAYQAELFCLIDDYENGLMEAEDVIAVAKALGARVRSARRGLDWLWRKKLSEPGRLAA